MTKAEKEMKIEKIENEGVCKMTKAEKRKQFFSTWLWCHYGWISLIRIVELNKEQGFGCSLKDCKDIYETNYKHVMNEN